MSKLAVVIARFPQRELDIWRRCTEDARFCEVCEDYAEAIAAQRHFETPGHADAAKAAEYRTLAADFEVEILSALG